MEHRNTPSSANTHRSALARSGSAVVLAHFGVTKFARKRSGSRRPIGAFFHVTAFLLALAASANTRADGDEYFIPHSRSLNPDGSRIQDVGGFMGNVKDETGKPIFDATITIAVNVETEAGPQRVTYTSYTDHLGHYRTYGPQQVVADLLQIETAINPADAQVVGVEKEGYVEARRLNRGRLNRSTGPVQVDFVVRRTTTSP